MSAANELESYRLTSVRRPWKLKSVQLKKCINWQNKNNRKHLHQLICQYSVTTQPHTRARCKFRNTSEMLQQCSLFHHYGGMCGHVTWADMTSQPDKAPFCQAARPGQKCVGGVMDLKTTVSAGHLATVPGPRWALSLRGTERWLEVWNSSHNRAEWAFVSWLITADSWLSPPTNPPSPTPLLCLPSITPLPALSCCSPVEKRYY